jgi:glycosyltransferase involved in cell wall biosynthesis
MNTTRPMPTAQDRRRILYVEGNVDGTIGGSFFSLLFLIQGLDKSRYDPVVVFSFEHRLFPRYESAGARVLLRPLAKAIQARSGLGRLFAKACNLALGFVIEPVRLAMLLKRERIDLVHLNNSIVRNHPWMMAAKLCGIPCITHERGINPSYSQRSVSLGQNLAAVVCISDAVRDNFASRGVANLPLVTIPNGLDPSEMKSTVPPERVREEFDIQPGRRLIGIVGNLKHWKGQEVVLRATALIKDHFPEIICLLVGDFSKDDAAYRNKINGLIAELKLEGHVIVTGYRPNVADYVNALEVLIHASIEPEPFGRVLLEGMALRKPLVASRGGAVPEIVVDGSTGLLFTAGDHQDLARATELLLKDPERIVRMGEAGYHRLIDHFSIDKNVADTQRLYASVIAAGPKAPTRSG